jgi:hypothetical protein
MSTISTQLRNFKDPTKDQIIELYFCIPPKDAAAPSPDEVERIEINATLSAGPETEEESYVRCVMRLHLSCADGFKGREIISTTPIFVLCVA